MTKPPTSGQSKCEALAAWKGANSVDPQLGEKQMSRVGIPKDAWRKAIEINSQHTPSIVERSSHIAIATSIMLGIWAQSAGKLPSALHQDTRNYRPLWICILLNWRHGMSLQQAAAMFEFHIHLDSRTEYTPFCPCKNQPQYLTFALSHSRLQRTSAHMVFPTISGVTRGRLCGKLNFGLISFMTRS